MSDLMNLFNDLDRTTQVSDKKDSKVLRAPFGYPGGKTKSVPNILKHLPYKKIYVEPFGGSAAVLLARQPVDLEVYNDRYGGVVAFYRCLRDPIKYQSLIDYLELTVHSREDFVDAKETWCDESDDVVRAAKWYYMVNYSFAAVGRNYGRSTSSSGVMGGKIRNKLKHFDHLHNRLKRVQIENQDWLDCMRDYDGKDTVFYLDPPYVDAYPGTYKYEMKHDDHRRLLETIFSLRGFCAVSGYSNPLYENQSWDAKYSWETFVSIESCSFTEGNCKLSLKDVTRRSNIEEVLWIREGR
jgi:DNA adenine methylase